jgi:succinyl-CoA synthetase beta subunit
MINHFTILQKIDQNFIDNSLALLESNPEQVTSNQTLMILLTYYLLSEQNYNKLLLLLNRTRNPEL